MVSRWRAAVMAAALVLSTMPNVNAWDDGGRHIRRVLLISIDGMHSVDFINCSSASLLRTLKHGRGQSS